ncbi:MAG TPA: hypothetical protein PLL18_12975, partial [Flavobacteriales bacterium]|nr:hypothetical protein [Flavobacteriales bacterium]
VLVGCDHALLIREDAITNRVASPTKFAEYLACGLPVVISPYIGDFSGEVDRERLGTVYSEGDAVPLFQRPSPADRTRLRDHAIANYTKAAHDKDYAVILRRLS